MAFMKKTNRGTLNRTLSLLLALSLTAVLTPLTASAATSYLNGFDDPWTGSATFYTIPDVGGAGTGTTYASGNGNGVDYVERAQQDPTDANNWVAALHSNSNSENKLWVPNAGASDAISASGRLAYSARFYIVDKPGATNGGFTWRTISDGWNGASHGSVFNLFGFHTSGFSFFNAVGDAWGSGSTIPTNQWFEITIIFDFSTSTVTATPLLNGNKITNNSGNLIENVAIPAGTAANQAANIASACNCFNLNSAGTVYVDDVSSTMMSSTASVVSTVPAEGGVLNSPAHMPTPNKEVVINFNEVMDAGTMTTTNIKLYDKGTSSYVTPGLSFSGKVLKVTVPPKSNASYALTLTNGVASFLGAPLAQTVLNFTTSALDYQFYNDFEGTLTPPVANGGPGYGFSNVYWQTAGSHIDLMGKATDENGSNKAISLQAIDTSAVANVQWPLRDLFGETPTGKTVISFKTFLPHIDNYNYRFHVGIGGFAGNTEVLQLFNYGNWSEGFFLLNHGMTFNANYSNGLFENSWNDIAIVYDFDTSEASAYMNGKCFADKVSLMGFDGTMKADINDPNNCLFFTVRTLYATTPTMQVFIDDLSVYTERNVAVTSVPANNGALTSGEMVLKFNNEMDTNTLTAEKITLVKNGSLTNLLTDDKISSVRTFENSAPGTKVTINMDTLNLGSYSLTLTGVKDVFGNVVNQTINFANEYALVKVTDIDFSYADGTTPVTSLISGKTLNITATVEAANPGGEAVIIAALYDDHRALAEVKTMPIPISGIGTFSNTTPISFNLTGNLTNYKLKVFVWDGFLLIRPLPYDTAASIVNQLPAQ